MADTRTILHGDLDAFFASVEQLDDPSLRGKPVLVGGAGRRGVVAAASYEARAFGCRSAMPTSIALRRCPHAVIVRGNFARYSELSSRVFAIFHDVSPIVQPLSIDEAFIDVTGSRALLGDGRSIAAMLRRRVRDEIGLTLSVGVATNKMVAKVASDADKPDGLTVVEPGHEAAFLAPRPAGVLPGIGPAAQKRLASIGLHTAGDVANAPLDQLRAVFGQHAEQARNRARGIDPRPVTTDRDRKSISQERTMTHDLTDAEQARALLLWHVESVSHRLRSKGLVAGAITLKLRFGDFETVTRSASLSQPTNTSSDLWHAARDCFDRWASAHWQPLRLLGFGVDHLTEANNVQAGLFDQAQRRSALDEAKDAVMNKFGKDAIAPAGALKSRRRDR